MRIDPRDLRMNFVFTAAPGDDVLDLRDLTPWIQSHYNAKAGGIAQLDDYMGIIKGDFRTIYTSAGGGTIICGDSGVEVYTEATGTNGCAVYVLGGDGDDEFHGPIKGNVFVGGGGNDLAETTGVPATVTVKINGKRVKREVVRMDAETVNRA